MPRPVIAFSRSLPMINELRSYKTAQATFFESKSFRGCEVALSRIRAFGSVGNANAFRHGDMDASIANLSDP